MAEKLRIGWIGTGVMGLYMAGHLQDLGLPLTVYNRTKAKADPLLAKGAQWADTPRAVAEASDVVFTMVSYPRDVEQVILGETGVLPGLAKGGVVCDMSTSSPVLAERIAAEALKKGCLGMDAPVTGGDVGAREGTLSIFVGGDKGGYERLLPCFEAMGKKILLCGPRAWGNGQARQPDRHCRRYCSASANPSSSRSRPAGRAPVERAGGRGSGGSLAMNNLGNRILKGDYAPGFLLTTSSKTWASALRNAVA
jgi:3-hydroxyisobutyrate dehydrogenase